MSTREKGTASGDATHAAHGDENPAVEAAMSRDVINIPDNVFLQSTSDYDPAERDALEWLLGYGRSELGGSRQRLCRAVGVEWRDVFNACSGTKGAGFETLLGRIRTLRTRVMNAGNPNFVETVVTRKIFDMLDYALAGDQDTGKMAMIIGPTGRSKTESRLEWARRNNHGKSVGIDSPVEGGLRGIARSFAAATGVGEGRKTGDIVPRVINAFHRGRIILVDEVARITPVSWASRPIQVEFIRKIHDTRKTAVVWFLTEHTRREMEEGEMKHYFEQLIGRVQSNVLHIPKNTRRDEARSIADHFCAKVHAGIGARGAPPKASDDLVTLAHEIALMPGRLRILFDYMRKTEIFAVHKRQALTVDHLRTIAKHASGRVAWPEDEQ